jgi:hypothetical protein
VADAERLEVELMKDRLSFDRGAYVEADEMCRDLLEIELPYFGSRYFVLEMMAQVRLKRREITRCLEIVEQMEREAALGYSMKTSRDRLASRSQLLNFSHSLSNPSPRVQGISFRSARVFKFRVSYFNSVPLSGSYVPETLCTVSRIELGLVSY